MGFALKKLGSEQCKQIASTLFKVENDYNNKCELYGLCPIHGEKTASFSYNYEKDTYHCFACGANGDLITLWGSVKGYTDKKLAFTDFCKQFDIDQINGDTAKKYNVKPVYIIAENIWDSMGQIPHDFKEKLKKSRGWTDQVFIDLDLRLQTQYLDGKSGEVKQVIKSNRVSIPIRNDKGKLINIRNYQPGAKKAKVISWGAGFGSAALFPPGYELKKGELIFLCEGEPDTICAISNGLNAITQTSKLVNWPDDHIKHFKGRDVVICYDADQAGQKYSTKAAMALIDHAKSVRIINWPEFMGVTPDGEYPKDKGQDLTDFFVRHKKTLDDFMKLVASASIYKKTEDNVDDPQGGIQFFKKVNGRWSFISRWLADQIIKDQSLMYDPKTGLLYRWNNKYWEKYSEDHIRQICLNYLGDESKQARVNDATFQAVLLATIPHGREPDDKDDWLCLQNKMININDLEGESLVTTNHEKDFFCTYALDVLLENNLVDCIKFKSFLDENIRTKEVIMQIQEFFGYCFTKDTRYGKCLFLLGPGSDGKSTLLKILRLLVSPRNCTSVSFKQLDDQFYLSSLYGKLLNISTEISSGALETDMFKKVVTGDPVTAAFKNKDPFEFIPYAKIAFSGNSLPRVRDNSEGLYRRFLPVRFKKQFFGDEDNKNLFDELKEELSGIFLWSLAGLRRLRRNQGFTECDETKELMMSYRRFNDPVLCFCEDRCVVSPEFDEGKDQLYSAYKSFCEKNGYNRMNKNTFMRELYRVKRQLSPKRATDESGKRIQRVSGIRVKGKGE